MISEHSAHSTPQPFGIRTWLWRYTCLLFLISMLWHRQAIFESKGDKFSSSAECRIRTHQGLRHQIASRLNAHWQTDWAIEDQAKNLNSTARPYDQRAFSPLDPTAVWHSHLALAIYMFVVLNFDALAQASDIRIERRQVVFICWMQDSNPSGSQTRFTSQMAAVIRSVGGLSKYFFQGLWLIILRLPRISLIAKHYGSVSSPPSARLLYGFPYYTQYTGRGRS